MNLPQFLVTGIAMGFIYSLIATEYTLIYNATGLVNFAHESFIVLGAYIFAGTFARAMDLYDKEIISIIGSNGAGKTTTMRSIMSLRIPKHGSITFQGTDITKMKTHNVIKQGIIYVPEGRLVFPDLSVQVNLEMGAYAKPYSRKELNEKMEEQFALFPRLKERRNQLAGVRRRLRRGGSARANPVLHPTGQIVCGLLV